MKSCLHVFLASTLLTVTHGIHAQGTAFTCQGRLNDGASPANGAYDLTFELFSVHSDARQPGNVVTSIDSIGNPTKDARVDADGVALAAIQGLNQKLEQKET